MFIGHFGVALSAKAIRPTISLGTLFLAAQFVDLLWPTLLLLGVERVAISPGITLLTPLDFRYYPFTHSLLMNVLWGAAVGAIFWWLRRDLRGALLLGVCVVSHWVLDFVVHRPDLPLYPGNSPLLGLGLWNSLGGTLLVEGVIFATGVVLYLRTTAARNRAGRIGFIALAAFLLLVWLANFAGPPPPSVAAIAWLGHAQWLLVVWAYWVDRNRVPRRVD
ncbi:MAG: hypothetical protein LJE84_08455 [Gammaproteobacteria bacterium]|jgi:membrane-bound metal-dependent hydrolase YbcI (DUF457 family)|nr:hypothetical protein [Gammaproteobacteria bacterium]